MKIVISPAKSLDFESKSPTLQFTEGIFLKEAERINAVIKRNKNKCCNSFKLIIMDVEMPIIDGYEVSYFKYILNH